MTCCKPGKLCTCRAWVWVWALVGVAALFVLFASMSGCAAGKAYERGPDGKMQERLVFGVDAGKLAEGVTAQIGSLTDPATLAALAGVVIPGAGALGAIFGLRRGERKGWDESQQAATQSQQARDAAFDEGHARALLAAVPRQTANTGFGAEVKP